MKQQLCFFACDVDGCDEESPAESTWAPARRAAKQVGWVLAVADYCPTHAVGVRRTKPKVVPCPVERARVWLADHDKAEA